MAIFFFSAVLSLFTRALYIEIIVVALAARGRRVDFVVFQLETVCLWSARRDVCFGLYGSCVRDGCEGVV